VDDLDPSPRAFLVTEKEPGDRQTCTLHVVNWDARYYANDRDYALGIVDSEGNVTGATSLVSLYGSNDTLASVVGALSDLVNNHLPH
jgi:hypothetical protein